MGKVTVKDAVKPNEFRPFTLEVTVETPDEYRELWYRLNMSRLTVNASRPLRYQKLDGEDCHFVESFWSALNEVYSGDYREKYIEKPDVEDDDDF